MATIKPERLCKGDVIGIISPSQAVVLEEDHREGFEKGLDKIQRLGYKIKLGQHTKEQYFYSAGTPKQRIDDFHAMFTDPNVKAILMSIGGDTANELLPFIDFELVREHPKILMGMSDGTTLLLPITDRTGLVTFYGPDLIYSFGIQKDTRPFDEQLFACITEGKAMFKPLTDIKDDEGNPIDSTWCTVRTGNVEGRLIGGYLEIVLNLFASGYLQNVDGSILYLESMEGSNPIHTRLQYLKIHGIFDRIGGLILGHFPDIHKDEKYYRPIEDIILELTEGKSFPILKVNELGHMVKNYTWPNGINVRLDSTNKEITALEACVMQ